MKWKCASSIISAVRGFPKEPRVCRILSNDTKEKCKCVLVELIEHSASIAIAQLCIIKRSYDLMRNALLQINWSRLNLSCFSDFSNFFELFKFFELFPIL